MTGRHAADAVDDESLAGHPQEPGAHRADDPQGVIGDGSVPADADLQADAPKPSGRRSKR